MEVKRNSEHNGIELYFDTKPAAAIIAGLKERRFKWHSVKKCWYAVATAANVEFASALADGGQTPAPAAKRATTGKAAHSAPILNKYGVKVGDLFCASWGYDQTNLDFFQVVELVGTQSVRVREVVPHILKDEDTGGSMSRYITCGVPKSGEMLPPVGYSIFINNQERGDLKRLNEWTKDDPFFRVGNGYLCTKYKGKRLYESWYA